MTSIYTPSLLLVNNLRGLGTLFGYEGHLLKKNCRMDDFFL